MPIATQIDWVRASSRSSRAMVTKPMPFNIAASGSKRCIRARCEPADCEVRNQVETEHPREQCVEVGRELRTVGQRDEDVAADRDDHREHAERELGPPPRARDERKCHRRTVVVVTRAVRRRRGRVVVVWSLSW